MQGVHKVVPKIKAMELDKTLNTIGLLTNVAYISLCTSTIEYFKKQEHPSAPAVVRDQTALQGGGGVGCRRYVCISSSGGLYVSSLTDPSTQPFYLYFRGIFLK